MSVAIDNLARLEDGGTLAGHYLSLLADTDGFLVGGAVRDALLGRALTDLDFAFPQDPTHIAKEFARRIDGHWFWLDHVRRQSRVVSKHDPDAPVCDFAPFRAASISRDLQARDFTINAMALKLADITPGHLIDPTDGLADLKHECLRMTSEDALRDDPLRIIKGVRHAAELDFAIVPSTLNAMRRQAPGIDFVALERVRLEVFKLLSAAHVERGLEQLEASGAGNVLFGHGFIANFSSVAAAVGLCRQVWKELVDADATVVAWRDEELEQGVTRATLLSFVFLMRAIHPELPEVIVSRWPLSRRSATNVLGLGALQADDVAELPHLAATTRAFALWARDKKVEPKLLLPAMAALATVSSESASDVLAWIPLVKPLDARPPGDLVDGHWLREVLRLKDGPEMGSALELLREAEMRGDVEDVAQARDFLVQRYHNKD